MLQPHNKVRAGTNRRGMMETITGSQTVAAVMRAGKGHTTGFDYLRIGLALGVVWVHCISIADFADRGLVWRSIFTPAFIAILPSFFALSGFLVSGSLLRNSIPQFVALRVLRIFPALAVEVLLSAFVLGTLFTTLPLGEYFRHPEFQSYLLNMLGIIHYTLPGVFEGKILNAQLWTIPAELECYILLVAVGLIGLVRRKGLFLALTCAACVAMTILAVRTSAITPENNLPGRVLVFAFAYGCLIYYFRETLPFNRWLFAGSLLLSYLLFSFPNLSYLATGPIAYATVYIGLQRWPRIPLGDLSYGLYLFHFPVARTIDELTGTTQAWPILFVETVLVTAIFAAGSWTLIEKPLLERKKPVLAAIDRLTGRLVRSFPALTPKEA